jgi:two-component system sensor histidine kinase UhpB
MQQTEISQSATDRMPWMIARLLRFPLFYKVLVANSLLITLGAIVGTRVSLSFGQDFAGHDTSLTIVFTLIGVALTITLNTVLLRAALQPVRSLRLTADALGRGDFSVRVPQSSLADADMAYVSEMLNQILDHLQRYQERVQDLSANVIQAQEDERHRIARELHDQIGQSLTLLLIRLKLLEASPAAGAVHADLADLRAAVAAAIDQVRRLALELRPPALDQLGLIPAIRTLVREFSEQTRIGVTCEAPTETMTLASERATALYRIVQEALTNVAKHAEARSVRVILERQRRDITVTIRDDGCGFDLPAIQACERDQEGPGLGIFGMEERVRLLGGAYAIATRPGAGTTITATIPLNPLESLENGTFDHESSKHVHPYLVS